jgi:hypothetical protein
VKVKKIYKTIILLLLVHASYGQNISIFVSSPNIYQITDSILSIVTTVRSTYSLTAVTASVDGRQTALQFDLPSGEFRGQLSLSGLSGDTLKLMVKATDALNNRDSIFVPVIYAPSPVLAIAQPIAFSVANPTVHVKAKCLDPNHGCTIVLNDNLPHPDSVDVDLDMSGYEGTETDVIITATDNKYPQLTTSQHIHIYVESDPDLKLLFAGPDKIWDFNFNHILTAKTIRNEQTGYNTLSNLKLIDLPDSAVVEIPYKGSIYLGDNPNDDWSYENYRIHAYVTATGAVFSGIPTDPNEYPYNNDSVYDWNQNTLYCLTDSILNSSGSLGISPNGKYAIWSEGLHRPAIRYRNLETRTNSAILPSPNLPSLGNYRNDIASDGTVVYWGSRPVPGGYVDDVLKFQANISTYISDSSEKKWAMFPVTDGKRTVYEKIINNDSFSIYLNDGDSTILLSDLGTRNITLTSGHPYLINQNYIAFLKLGTSGQFEIWLRDSTRNASRISIFGTDCQLEKLGLNGDVVFINQNKRYWSDRNGTLKEIGSGLFGKVFQIDNQWYEAIGRNLYGIPLNPISNSITSFTRHLAPDSAYSFKTEDFDTHFSGGGSLMNIKITMLPLHGQLLYMGNPVALNSVFNRAVINQLQYVPDVGTVAADSLKWKAGNGFAFTAGDAYVFFDWLALPEIPLLNSLDSSYCGNAGSQKIQIGNFPDLTDGYGVSVKLDSVPLPLTADSSFMINLSGLSEGSHVITVKFTNSSGASSKTALFSLILPVTPHLTVSSSANTVTAVSPPVIISATDLAGGGNNPEYLFASDSLFNNILQAGSSDTYALQPANLNIGNNLLYVRMKTSDSCYSVLYDTDSVNIVRNSISGLVDPDFPGQLINIYPNPFNGRLSLNGLQASKSYSVSFTDINGHEIALKSVANQTSLHINITLPAKGLYLLKVYDNTKGRVIGAVKVMAR